jgi:hypothetical protein
MLIHFVFVGEGSSDDGLIPHLENLCIEAGATEVTGVALDFRRLPEAVGHSVQAKVRAASFLEPEANLLFVHRDADSRDGSARYDEVAGAAAACGCRQPVVCVVPVQETEAWLLLDESAIRRVVGRPAGTVRLDLPKPDAVERLARPKERLKAVLAVASETSGRRLERVKQDFPQHRRALLQDLPTTGPLESVSSWERMRRDLAAAIQEPHASVTSNTN